MKRDSRKTKDMASGHWLDILRDLAPELAPAIEKLPNHVQCPYSQKGTDGFRLFKDANQTGGGVSNSHGVFPDGFNLLMWINDWKFPEAHDAVYEWLNGCAPQKPAKRQFEQSSNDVSTAEEAKKRRYLLNKLWTQTGSLDSMDASPASTYLAKRRCFPLPWDIPDLAFHKSLQYKSENGLVQNHPGMLAVVRDRSGKAVTLHRTFLSENGGKAVVANPKRMMPVPQDTMVTGGAIRLQPANWEGEIIGVAEGIETALSVSCATNMVCWSTMSSTLLATFTPPEWVKQVVIWADCDKQRIVKKNGKLIETGLAGQKAAHGLQDRLWKMGVESEIRIPPAELVDESKKSTDWADVYCKYGRTPFLNGRPESWAI